MNSNDNIEKAHSQEMVIYKSPNGDVKVDVLFTDETVWLTQAQIGELFGKAKSTISEHIKNIFEEGELVENMVVRNFRTTTQHGATENKTQTHEVKFYNLDVIISVGYRVKSLRGTQFRQWATKRLNEYIRKGFTLDDNRLKNLGGGGYWKELIERICDIRSSEKVFYRQILDIYATSAEKEFMGLTTFEGNRPHLKDTVIAKNYLDEKELRAMGQIVSGYLDFAERQAERQQTMTMKDWVAHLDKILTMSGEQLLLNSGKVSHQQAIDHATSEHIKYQQKTLSQVEQDFLDSIKSLPKK